MVFRISFGLDLLVVGAGYAALFPETRMSVIIQRDPWRVLLGRHKDHPKVLPWAGRPYLWETGDLQGAVRLLHRDIVAAGYDYVTEVIAVTEVGMRRSSLGPTFEDYGEAEEDEEAVVVAVT